MDYGSVNAKVAAMRGKLLKEEDYYNLASLTDVYEVAKKLKDYEPYSVFAERISAKEAEHNRHSMENRLMLLPDEDYRRIYSFISDNRLKNYLKAFTLNKDIRLIKLILCSLFDERDIADNYEELSRLSAYDFTVDAGALANSKSVMEFIDNLRGTAFYDVLKDSYYENINLFDIEMKLDFFYYDNLWRAKNRYLTGKNKKIMTTIVGIEIDLQNIAWIYRLKTYYQISNELIYQYIIPITYRVENDRMARLIEADTTEEIAALIQNTPYSNLFSNGGSFERKVEEIMKNAYLHALRTEKDSMSSIMEYLFSKDIEISNLISLLEGVRYSLKPAEIMNFLCISGY